MDRAVLDTSVLIKSLFKPMKSLSSEIYAREVTTHSKCKAIVKLLEDRDVEVYIPRICIIETAAVARRISGKSIARKVSRSIRDSYEVIEESILFDIAWEIALDTGCSGFDSYFIALSKVKNASLLTDDGGMYHHARELDIQAALMRENEFEAIEDLFEAA
jgi:predicted nucleic acid-binding protein